MKYKAVSAGEEFIVAIKDDDTLFQTGRTKEFQLLDFPEGLKTKLISSGRDFSVAVLEDGTLVQWGSKMRGSRNDFPAGVKVKAIACGSGHTIAIKEDDTLIQWGDSAGNQRKRFPAGIKVKAISAKWLISVAINEDGYLVKWGNPPRGIDQQIPPDKVKALACGIDFFVAIKEDDTLLHWGGTASQQLTDFPGDVKVKAIACGLTHSIAIKEDGTLIQWGDDREKQRDNFPAGIKVKAIAGSEDFSVAIKEDDTLVLWGKVPPEINIGPQLSPIDKLEKDTPEELDPNPYPKFKGKIAIESLPRKPETYKATTTAYDALMVDHIKLDDILADEDKPLLVKVRDTYSTLHREYINGGITDGSLIRYGCNKALGLAVYPSNVYGKNPLVYIKGLESGNFIVLLSELDAALKDPSVRAIELTESPDVFPTVASFASIMNPATNKNYNGQEVNLVSADHCQAGSQQKVYNITVLDLTKSEEGGKRRRTYRKRGKKKTQKKRRSYKRSTK